MAFSDKLREEMTNKDVSAAELARRTGLSEAIISEYRSGKKEPRGKQSVLISKALDISLDDLWETGFQKEKTPAVQQESSHEEDITMEQSTRLLVGLGFIREGEQLSDRDLAFLSGILNALDAYFEGRK